LAAELASVLVDDSAVSHDGGPSTAAAIMGKRAVKS